MNHLPEGAGSGPIFQSISWEEIERSLNNVATVVSKGPIRGKAVKTRARRKPFVPFHHRPHDTRRNKNVQRRRLPASIVTHIDTVNRPDVSIVPAEETWDFLIGISLAGTMLSVKNGSFDDDISDITPCLGV
jgi:hypothetical protein